MSVVGVGGVTITTPSATFTYYASGSSTPLSGAPTDAGSYTVVATFAGSTDYKLASSAVVGFVISQAVPQSR